MYLLVLVGCDCGKLRLGERESLYSVGRQRLDLRQVEPRVMPDDVNTRFVLMHRLQDDLGREIDGVKKVSTGKCSG